MKSRVLAHLSAIPSGNASLVSPHAVVQRPQLFRCSTWYKRGATESSYMTAKFLETASLPLLGMFAMLRQGALQPKPNCFVERLVTIATSEYNNVPMHPCSESTCLTRDITAPIPAKFLDSAHDDVLLMSQLHRSEALLSIDLLLCGRPRDERSAAQGCSTDPDKLTQANDNNT
ncbi:hypothetical protein EVAR_28096_1 [Eumeta japonica]|uniref:Uncharacterized protein n=1 Tax=Eumeta variegata TaxID=151549 RepID=A0A4C1W9I7_EUMVA|nr:hypothetical protein EVAR_28096_1 [Eumeta japonica]